MKKILALILALMMVVALAACGAGGGNEPAPADGNEPAPTDTAEPTDVAAEDDDWAYIQDTGTLVIDDGKLIGFDTEFAEAVC